MKARLVPIEEAVGMLLPHDVTEIRPQEFKGPAFKKGHLIRKEDIDHLKQLGKDHIYVLEIEHDELHEDEAAIRLARAVAGEGVSFSPKIVEGKVTFLAKYEGLFKVNVKALYELNLLGDIILSTRHTDFFVHKGEPLAAGRAIPLVVKKKLLEDVERIVQRYGPLLRVKSKVIQKTSLVITGNEVYYGRIEDAFVPALLPKIKHYGLDVLDVCFCPDDRKMIKDTLEKVAYAGAELILVTGGMSVDPDDVTRFAVADLGAEIVSYGSPVLPGAMFLVAYYKGYTILGVPACAMYFQTTILDLVLPRVICGEKISRQDIAALGHGGFCLQCKECRFPLCPFGRGSISLQDGLCLY